MSEVRARVGEGGWIVIPAEYWQALGIAVGDEIVLRLEGDEVRILTRQHAIRQAQALIRQYVPADRSLVDELISERRLEAGRE